VSKADFYRDELVPEVEEQVVAGLSAKSAMAFVVLSEEGIDGKVLTHWVLKKHGSEESLETWAAQRREAIEQTASKYGELRQIIRSTPIEKLTRAVIPQFAEWHRWIQRNAWSDPEVKAEALAFAKNEIWRRRASSQAVQEEEAPND